MMHFVLRAFLALALTSALSEAWGQPFDKVAAPKPDIHVDLLTGSSETREPHSTWIGVRVALGPGWKTYWKSPGEAGLPTEFDWSGSSNVVSAEVNWPAPTRLSILGTETVGYTHEVVFPVKVKLGDTALETRIHLQLAVYACSTICVREDHVLAATLRPGASVHSQAKIDEWRSRVPQPTSNVLSVLSVERSTIGPASLSIEIASTKPLTGPDAFIDSDPPLSGDRPVVTLGIGNRATLTVNVPGETAESIRTRTVTATVVSDGASVVAVSPGSQTNGEAGVTASEGRPSSEVDGGLLTLIGIALAGGFILNLMPCGFPVLSLKLLSFVHGSAAGRGQVRKGFAASAAGILVSFLVLAGGLAVMKAAGASVGWGIQFQQPWFLGGMAVVLVLFAANQFELLSLPVSSGFLTRVSGMAGGASTTSHFLSGLVATLLATPCSAPLVGTAVGFALSQGTAEIFSIFAALGVGMASPYLIVAAFPAMANVIPRPGPWLVHVKRIFGVALVATAGWLLIVFSELTAGTLAISIGATLAAGLTVLSLWKGSSPKSVAAATGTIGLVVAVVAIFMSQPQAPNRNDIPWRTFSRSDLRLLVDNGRTVFVDVTADWCIACKINKALVINRKEIAGRLASDVVPMRADWTKPNADIAQFMREHGRFGIPFNIVFGPNAPDGIPLSEILSTSSVSNAFNDASPVSTNPLQK